MKEKTGKQPIQPPTKPFIPNQPLEPLKSPNADENTNFSAKPDHHPAPIGTSGKIGKPDIDKAAETLSKYKAYRKRLDERVIENEKWWKLRHWEQMRAEQKEGNAIIDPVSAWLFNSVINKHADAMDNYPEPNILPREQNDKKDAETLSSVLPVILDQNEYEQTYSNTWWDKIKNGTGVKGLFWNPKKMNGLGDVEIRQIDLLNIHWEPGISDIQESENVFTTALVSNDILKAKYPFLDGKLSSASVEPSGYPYDDAAPVDGKSEVVDWYYKRESESGRQVLHYCKFCNGALLYASENTEAFKERGFYDHGKYPFVFDVLFPNKGSPCGFGYIDIMKDAQMYIDKIDAVTMENILQAGKARYFFKMNGSVNEEEFADFSKQIVHVNGTLDDSIKPIQTPALPGVVPSVRQMKIDELKETSGNRDFSQGSTASGVTAAAAIAALQEAGSKLSRDMIKSAYRAFQKECSLIIELIRQFYDEPRYFRITGSMGQEDFTSYNNAAIKSQTVMGDFGGDEMSRVPVFDIKIKAQRSNPFNTAAQNENMKELYGMRFFDPANADQALLCLEGMTLEGKERIMQQISQNGTMYQQLQQMQQQLMAATQLIDKMNGSNLAGQAAAQVTQQNGPGQGAAYSLPANTAQESAHTANARQRTADSTSPM